MTWRCIAVKMEECWQDTGPIANDDIGMQMRRIDADLITWEQFVKELEHKDGETYQYFFGTEKALDTLYNSETYTKVLDLRMGLFSQSTVYEDHIYPQASFRTKDLRKRGLSDEAIEQYQSVYNSIANLELLEDSENKSKNATPFDEWIKSREKNFKDRHLIPEINDYGYDHFMEFIEARKKLIKAAIKKAAFEKVDNQEI